MATSVGNPKYKATKVAMQFTVEFDWIGDKVTARWKCPAGVNHETSWAFNPYTGEWETELVSKRFNTPNIFYGLEKLMLAAQTEDDC